MKIYFQALKLFTVLSIVTGIIYPLVMTEVAQIFFPIQANGTIAALNDKNIGSLLLAQKFESPKYFWPRPSSIDFNPIPSGATNLGPTSADLKKQISDRQTKLGGLAPTDLITCSGSGLDPHISPAAAYFQAARIAKERNLGENGEKKLLSLIDSLTQKRGLNIFGEPRVNVLELNLALDRGDRRGSP